MSRILIIFLAAMFLSGCASSKADTDSILTANGTSPIALPKAGEIITNERAIVLCRYYQFDYLVKRIEYNPERYKKWKFDGVSMAPDALFSWLFGIPNVVQIALRHDLKYAYGEKGNKAEKKEADLAMKQEVIADGGPKWVAKLMYKAVNTFGKEKYKYSFSWGFAHK